MHPVRFPSEPSHPACSACSARTGRRSIDCASAPGPPMHTVVDATRVVLSVAAAAAAAAAAQMAASTRCIQPGSRASCRILHALQQLLSQSRLQRGSGRCSRCTWPSHAPRQLLSQSRQRPLCCMRHELPPKPRPSRQSCCRGHGSGHCMRRSSCIVAAATAATARAGAAAVTATAAAVACATAAALSAAAAIAHAPRQLLPQPRQQPLHAVPSGRWTPGTGE